MENQCDCRSILSKPAITLNFLKKITRLVKFLLAVWGFELGSSGHGVWIGVFWEMLLPTLKGFGVQGFGVQGSWIQGLG